MTTWKDCNCKACGAENMIDSKEEAFECGECNEINE